LLSSNKYTTTELNSPKTSLISLLLLTYSLTCFRFGTTTSVVQLQMWLTSSKILISSELHKWKLADTLLISSNFETIYLPLSENKAIGIDLGIKTFAVLSNRVEIENPKHLRKSIEKLKKLQRKVSKKQKGSSNRKKSIVKLAKLHEKVANQRLDFLHKTTYYLVTNYDTLCLETLKANNMMKNHKLAQALSDISIGKFNDILDYKAEWFGCNILRIGQFEPSSKMCSCGVINKELKLSDRNWVCKSCGTIHNRDLLAANNIKKTLL